MTKRSEAVTFLRNVMGNFILPVIFFNLSSQVLKITRAATFYNQYNEQAFSEERHVLSTSGFLLLILLMLKST